MDPENAGIRIPAGVESAFVFSVREEPYPEIIGFLIAAVHNKSVKSTREDDLIVKFNLS